MGTQESALNSVKEMLCLLDKWRHFPKYQLERRFDIFLAPYLKEIVLGSRGIENHNDWTLIPEFPVKKKNSFQTWNVDYVLLKKRASEVIYVELKTDQNSVTANQLANYERIAGTGKDTESIDSIVRGIIEVAQRSSHFMKYAHLLD